MGHACNPCLGMPFQIPGGKLSPAVCLRSQHAYNIDTYCWEDTGGHMQVILGGARYGVRFSA